MEIGCLQLVRLDQGPYLLVLQSKVGILLWLLVHLLGVRPFF